MGLAGNMKLKHFRLIAAGGIVAACGGCFGIAKLMPDPEPAPYDDPWQVPDADPVATTSGPASTPPVVEVASGSWRDAALALRGTTASGGKVKDVDSGASYKINAYQDDGEASVNRLKVDLDRDDKWDVKWSFHADGTVTEQRASADDESYDVECTIPQGAQQCGAAETPAAPVSSAGSPSDQVALGYVGRDLGSGKLKDVTKGRPFKVNVYQDDGATSATRAKVDLDRDDAWDEKWTFDGSTVSKQVSPNDDESYTQTLTWTGSDWE